MFYSYKEYDPEFVVDFKTIPKKMAAKSFVNYIFDVLNNKTYADIETFFKDNSTFELFLKNYVKNVGKSSSSIKINSSMIIRHFGGPLEESDYQLIIQSIFKLTEKKRSFNGEQIKTTDVDKKEVVSYKNEENDSIYLINSNDKSISEQLEEKQKDDVSYQTLNADQNASNMLKDLENHSKESLHLVPLKDLISDLDSLNEKDRELIFEVVSRSSDIDDVKVDLENGMYIDNYGNVSQIKNKDGDIKEYGGEDNTTLGTKTEEKTYQKTYQMTKNFEPVQ